MQYKYFLGWKNIPGTVLSKGINSLGTLSFIATTCTCFMRTLWLQCIIVLCMDTIIQNWLIRHCQDNIITLKTHLKQGY